MGFPVIDLRALCNEAVDYSPLSPIESSSVGGMKIAENIAAVIQKSDFRLPRMAIF
jgi:hypothetical protein